MKTPAANRRALPAVDRVMQALGAIDLPRTVVVAAVREEIAVLRRSLAGSDAGPDDVAGTVAAERLAETLARVRDRLERLRRSRLQPVINGTGVLIHTNLGRAPLGPAVIEALTEAAGSYSNLEFDLVSGGRGGRAAWLEQNLALLFGAEAATIANNCAAALVLLLRHCTGGARKEVLISRGELIQIGGGFRIPDILETSGARLREVGTTNRTELADYERACSPQTGLILKVHRSNFFMGGFVASPDTAELAALARRRRVPLIEDLGSGAIRRTETMGLGEHEPTPAEVLRAGVELVCFSGDKLFGGPQAGIIAGRARRVRALKRDPLFRALRCDKLVLAAMQATVDLHLASEPADALPLHGMLQVSCAELQERAARLVAALSGLPLEVRIGRGKSRLGGGTMPRTSIDSVTLDLRPATGALDELAARLRAASPPVIGHLSAGALKLDLRTVFPHQDAALADAIRQALES